jgi:hypothetical protein
MGRTSEHLDIFLKVENTFLDAKEHDNLLVDEETLSRSRKYFWTFCWLLELIIYLKNTIQHHQWEYSRDRNKIFDDFQLEKSKVYNKEDAEI